MQQVLGLSCGTAVVGSYQSTYTVCTPHRPKGSTTDLSHMTCRFAFLRWAGAAACHAAAAGCWIGWLRQRLAAAAAAAAAAVGGRLGGGAARGRGPGSGEEQGYR
jgi:hypothetical protein